MNTPQTDTSGSVQPIRSVLDGDDWPRAGDRFERDAYPTIIIDQVGDEIEFRFFPAQCIARTLAEPNSFRAWMRRHVSAGAVYVPNTEASRDEGGERL